MIVDDRWVCGLFCSGLVALMVVVGCGEPVEEEPEQPDLSVVITDGPPEVTAETNAELFFECEEEADCDFECRLDGGWVSCESPVSYEDLDDGEHTFEVRGVYGASSGDPAAWSWTVDTQPPEIVGLDGPEELTNETAATFDFECSKDDCDYTCSLDGGDPESCSPAHTYEDLDDGDYQFSVYATDELGNEGDEAVWAWTVDTEPPEIEITQQPEETIYESTATIGFECVNKDHCDFECAHDVEPDEGDEIDGDFEECVSPETLDDLDLGVHVLRIRATDAAGNQAETSVEWTFSLPAWKSISAGDQHTCGVLETGSLWCWGDFFFGKLGIGDVDESQLVPRGVGADEDWASVGAFRDHSCGLRDDASLWCWGDNILDQLGLGGADGPDVPAQVDADTGWVAVDAGERHTCAIADDDTLWCWGSDLWGHLGLGDTDGAESPEQVGDAQWKSVAAGNSHTCGVQDDGTLWCWGNGENGTLGQGDEEHHDTPKQVGDDQNWASVTAGTGYNCAIRDDGTLWCWGLNSWGKLGVGDEQTRYTPEQVGEADDWIAVSGQSRHTCGLRDDGTLWCWGTNSVGQLGLGDDQDRLTPHQVGDDTWRAVSAGTSHTCAIRDDDRLWCWGSGREGRLGMDDETDRDTPAEVLLSPAD